MLSDHLAARIASALLKLREIYSFYITSACVGKSASPSLLFLFLSSPLTFISSSLLFLYLSPCRFVYPSICLSYSVSVYRPSNKHSHSAFPYIYIISILVFWRYHRSPAASASNHPLPDRQSLPRPSICHDRLVTPPTVNREGQCIRVPFMLWLLPAYGYSQPRSSGRSCNVPRNREENGIISTSKAVITMADLTQDIRGVSPFSPVPFLSLRPISNQF